MSRYIFTGTEKDLIDNGFEIQDFLVDKIVLRGNSSNENSIIVSLYNGVCDYLSRELAFNILGTKKEIKPYIQDLIDKGLVEVLENE